MTIRIPYGDPRRDEGCARMKESELQANVGRLALSLGHFYYHTYDSRRSPSGFPDVVIVVDDLRVMRDAPSCVLFAELKTEKGQLTADQKAWGLVLGAVASKTPFIAYHVWRPTDWLDGSILRALTGKSK